MLTRPIPVVDDTWIILNYFREEAVQEMIKERVSPGLLEQLPLEMGLSVCRFLCPFPPVVAVGETQRFLKLVAHTGPTRPKVTCLEGITQGKSLYLIYRKFRGISYLADIQEEGNESSRELPLSGSKLIVARDHFGIVDVRCVTHDHGLELTSKSSILYYSVFDLREARTEGLTLFAYSTVGR